MMNLPVAQRTVVALTPHELPQAQADLVDWCRRKVLDLSLELRDARANCRQAKAAKWKHVPWLRVVQRTAAKMTYYTKIKMALQAGYLIVPNFNVDVMAVRVNRERPPQTTATYEGSARVADAKAELLPPGVGRYVDGKQYVRDDSYTEPDPKDPSRRRDVPLFTATRYDNLPDFPVLAVKPLVLEATARAMALKLFDHIGVVTNLQQDPVVVGEFLHPADRYRLRRVTFFIAWWLDTREL